MVWEEVYIVESEQEQFRPYRRIEGIGGKQDPRTHAYRWECRKRHRTPEQQARHERLSGRRPASKRPTPPVVTPKNTSFDLRRVWAALLGLVFSLLNRTSAE